MELCYVLKTIPYKDRDLIASLFSETRGRFSGIARNGVQSKRFGGSLGLFTASHFELDPRSIRIAEASDENLVQLLSGTVKHSSESLGKSFERLSAASALNEIVLRTIPAGRPSPELFKLYANALLAIEAAKPEQVTAVVNAFILKITQWLGVQPSLIRCIHCEKTLSEVNGDSVFPQIAKGAWLCIDCAPEKKISLSKMVLLDAYHSMISPIRKIEFVASEKEHENLLDMLEKHLQYFVPGLDKAPLNALKYLKNPMQEFLQLQREVSAHRPVESENF